MPGHGHGEPDGAAAPSSSHHGEAPMVATRQLTTEDVERLGSAGERMELIDGELREKAGVSQRHGEIEIRMTLPLGRHVFEHGLGEIYPSDTQFTVSHDPDTVLIPDLAFVRADRVPSEAERWHMAPFAPDLVVEVISPSDRYVEVMEKVDRYVQAGVPLIWLVDPRRRVVEVHALGRPPITLHESDTLNGGEVLPEFALLVADIVR
jgi:Uma2 family endonuclease